MKQKSLQKGIFSDETHVQIPKETVRERLSRAIAARGTSYAHLEKPPKDYLTQIALAEEMLAWYIAKREANITVTLNSFPLSKNMHPWRFKNIAKHNEDFAEYLDTVKAIIADRLTIGALTRELDGGTAMRLLPCYDTDYKDLQIEMARLKDESQARQPVTVIIEEFPRSSIVPERIEVKDE